MITFKDMEKDIAKARNELAKKKSYGDFGAEEYRKIRDTYFSLCIENYGRYYTLLKDFAEWCGKYEGVL